MNGDIPGPVQVRSSRWGNIRGRLFAFCLCSITLPLVTYAQVRFEFGLRTATYRSVLQLRDGNRLLIGSAPRDSQGDSSYLELTLLGDQPNTSSLPYFGGGGHTFPQSAALDPEGNVWITGWTDSEDFKLVKPIFAAKVPYQTTGFVAKLDPTAHQLLFSTFLGSQFGYSRGGTYPSTLVIDTMGNVYVGGATADTDFPTRGGFRGCTVFSNSFGDHGNCSFIAKITPAGTLAYSATVTAGGGCTGSQSSCIGRNYYSANVHSMAVDASGAVTMSGALGGTFHFPYGYTTNSAYVCRVAPDASRLLWYLTTSADKLLLALDPEGNVHLFGVSVPVQLPSSVRGVPVLFMDRVNAGESALAGRQVLAESQTASPVGILTDKQGSIYLSGRSASSDFPLVAADAPNLGNDFVVKVDHSGSPVQPVLRLPGGALNAPPAFDSSNRLMLLGPGGALLTVPNDYHGLGTPAIVAFANSASFALNTGLFPGALLTLYGFNLPVKEPDFQVQVNGAPAPVLFAGPNQINLQVPFKMAEYGQANVTVSPGNLSVEAHASRSIGIFTSDGFHAAALNQDGTINSQANPAAGGSVVVLFGTGARWPSQMTDGAVTEAPLWLDPDQNKLEALNTNQTPLAIVYAGTAPGIRNGVFQTNILLPPNLYQRTGSYGITLYSRREMLSSNVVQVYYK